MLLSGGGNTGRYASDPCSNEYMTGYLKYDVAIVASVAGFVVLLGILVILIGSTKPGRRWVSGPEGVRVRMAREALSRLSLDEA